MKILFVLSRFPAPAQTGDRLRATQQMRHLAQNHDVHLLCLSDTEPSAAEYAEVRDIVSTLEVIPHGHGRIARNLAGVMLGDLPIQTQMFQSDGLSKAIKGAVAHGGIDVVVSQLARITPNVGAQPVPHVLDFVDALSLGLDRRANSSPLPTRLLFSQEAKRMARLEARAGRRADERVVTSPVDAAHLEALGMGPVHVVPVGVADDFFETRPAVGADAGADYEYDLVFTGNLGYAANVVACEFLVEEVLPLLVRRLPDVRIALVGARPAQRVLKLAAPNVHIHGPVPDLRPFFRRSRAAIAPMRIGSGIQLKLLESMAMGVPTITTPLANTALGAEPDRDLLLGATAAQLADAAHRILTSPDGGHALGTHGQAFVSERYRWGQLNTAFESILTKAVEANATVG